MLLLLAVAFLTSTVVDEAGWLLCVIWVSSIVVVVVVVFSLYKQLSKTQLTHE